MQIRRDLELALLAARRKKIPLIIGSAGGSGANRGAVRRSRRDNFRPMLRYCGIRSISNMERL